MRWITQTLAVMALNLRTIPARLGSSSVAVIGIAGVVVVFVSVLSIGAGFEAAMRGSGSDNRALVMRSGADSEMTSGLGGPEVDIIKQAPGIQRNGQTLLASAELYVILDLRRKGDPDSMSNVPLRGVEPTAMPMRSEVSLIAGRMLEFGTNEVIVGRGAHAEFADTGIGETIRSGKNAFQVVGVFEADGGVAESEVWADARTLQGAYQRGNSYQIVLAQLETRASFEPFKNWLSTNPQLDTQVRLENEYYRSQSRAMTTLIGTIGYGIVASRAREIATLRALGFNTLSVVISVLGESLALGALGGIIGGGAAYLAFNGYQAATMNWQTFSQVAFAFRVTPELLMTGLIYSLSMGLLGGLLPAIRAARLPISSALREL
jgi:putative ABC transport system permease protein